MEFLIVAVVCALGAGIAYTIITLKTKLAHSEERYDLCNKQRSIGKIQITELQVQLHKSAKCSTTAAGKEMYFVTIQLIGFPNGQQSITHWSDTVMAKDTKDAIGIMLFSDEYKKRSRNNQLGLFGWTVSLITEEDHNAVGYYKKEESPSSQGPASEA